MKPEYTIKLAEHRLGRAWLHLKCLARGGKWSWYLAGLWWEIFGSALWLGATASLFATTLSCVAANSSGAYSEPFRPQYHFTPEKNWMNYPNGIFLRRRISPVLSIQSLRRHAKRNCACGWPVPLLHCANAFKTQPALCLGLRLHST